MWCAYIISPKFFFLGLERPRLHWLSSGEIPASAHKPLSVEEELKRYDGLQITVVICRTDGQRARRAAPASNSWRDPLVLQLNSVNASGDEQCTAHARRIRHHTSLMSAARCKNSRTDGYSIALYYTFLCRHSTAFAPGQFYNIHSLLTLLLHVQWMSVDS